MKVKQESLQQMADRCEIEMEKSAAENHQVGLLNGEYKEHILDAYRIAQQLKELGYERPWIIVKETLESGGPDELTTFTVRVEKKLRLEIR